MDGLNKAEALTFGISLKDKEISTILSYCYSSHRVGNTKIYVTFIHSLSVREKKKKFRVLQKVTNMLS